MNVGLFGGTFNPIHNGHITVITHVKKTYGLDTIHLIPSAIPPHKPMENLAPALDRLQMVQQAILTTPGLTASDVELKRRGRSFSIDTILQFKLTTPPTPDLFFIMGMDAFFDMSTWKGTCDIFQEATVIVMTRAGEKRKLKDIEYFLKHVISSKYRSTGNFTFLNSDSRFKAVHMCKVPEIPISSTEIRERIKNNLPLKGFVPDFVESIIIKKGLYLDKQT